MERENLKLVSCRIDPDTLRKIESMSKHHSYWKRNSVINNVLSVVFNHFTEQEIYDMLRLPFTDNYEVDCHFSIERKRLPFE